VKPVMANGRPWIILASGPSQCAEDIDAVRQYRRDHGAVVVAVNNQVFAAPWTDVLYACDAAWWSHYGCKTKSPDTAQALREFVGEKVSIDAHALRYGVTIMRRENGGGLGRNGLRTGNNSGYQAINLAWHRGARCVILMGYDMQHTGGKTHSHADHPRPLGNFRQPDACKRPFDALASDLKNEGVRVINATRETALRCFERMPLADALSVAKTRFGQTARASPASRR
jgi:hypothetical protein